MVVCSHIVFLSTFRSSMSFVLGLLFLTYNDYFDIHLGLDRGFVLH